MHFRNRFAGQKANFDGADEFLFVTRRDFPGCLRFEALQDTMQDLVGIVRREVEMQKALSLIGVLWDRSTKVGVSGNRDYNPGWHTALDLKHLLTVSEAVTRSAIALMAGLYWDIGDGKTPAK